MSTIQIPIVIITRDRSPKKNYLQKTLDNLARGGVFESEHFHSMTILDDASSEDYTNTIKGYIHAKEYPVELVTHDERAGSKGNAERAHRRLYSLSNEYKWGMVMEDDIDVCTRFLESVVRWLTKHEKDDYRLYFMALPSVPKRYKNDLYKSDSFYGSQCYVVRTAESESIADYLQKAGPFNNGHDTKLMAWLRKNYDKKKYRYVVSPAPTLIQHIGTDSSIQKDRERPKPEFHFIGKSKEYHG